MIRCLLLCSLMLLASYAKACSANQDYETLHLEADLVIYAEDCDAIRAEGSARAVYDGRTLTADKIIYMRNTKEIMASGNVVVRDAFGDLHYFQAINYSLHDGHGRVLDLKSRLHNNVLISVASAVASSDKKYKIFKATISPCSICASNLYPDRPLWQVRAEEVEMDSASEQVKFTKMTVEYLGKPIFYLPVMTVPTPNAKAKSGFLFPDINISKNLGVRATIPYYIKLAPNMDATFSPTLSTSVSSAYTLEFRHKIKSGEYKVVSNITRQHDVARINDREFSGYLKSDGKFKSEVGGAGVNYGFDINKLFNDSGTYLKKYDISDDDIMKTHVYLDHYNTGRSRSSYVSLEGLAFQDLRPEAVRGETPAAAPLLRYYHKKQIDFFNSEIMLTSKAYNLFRDSQKNQNSIVTDFAIATPLNSGNGHVLSIKNGMLLNLHHYDFKDERNLKNVNALPYSQLSWKYPLLATIKSYPFIIEPVASILLMPNSFSTQEEDLLEVRQGNFLSANRFSDWESIFTSSRLDYGANMLFQTGNDSSLDVFLGGSNYFDNSRDKPARRNDYLNNVSVKLNNNTFLINRLWLNSRNLNIMQHELDSVFMFHKTNFILNYTYRRQEAKKVFPQEIGAGLQYNFYRGWWINIEGKMKLNDMPVYGQADDTRHKKRLLSDGIGLMYKDDCLQADFAIKRDHTQTKDLKPSVSYIIKIGIPTFGLL